MSRKKKMKMEYRFYEVPEKYYLSPKACQGILRRASVRGKELPEVLRTALERQACACVTRAENA